MTEETGSENADFHAKISGDEVNGYRVELWRRHRLVRSVPPVDGYSQTHATLRRARKAAKRAMREILLAERTRVEEVMVYPDRPATP